MNRSHPHPTSTQYGFTLIELLLYVAVVGVLLTAVTLLLGTVSETRIRNQSASEVQQQAQMAMSTIAQTIRNADSVTAPAAATSASSLTLGVPTTSASPTIFSLTGGAVQIKEGSAAAISLTGGKVQATALTFRNLSRSGTPGAIQVSLTLARQNSGNRAEYDYTRTFITTVSLRP